MSRSSSSLMDTNTHKNLKAQSSKARARSKFSVLSEPSGSEPDFDRWLLRVWTHFPIFGSNEHLIESLCKRWLSFHLVETKDTNGTDYQEFGKRKESESEWKRRRIDNGLNEKK